MTNKTPPSTKYHISYGVITGATAGGIVAAYLYCKSKLFPPKNGEKAVDDYNSILFPATIGAGMSAGFYQDQLDPKKGVLHYIGHATLFAAGVIAGGELIRFIFAKKEPKKTEHKENQAADFPTASIANETTTKWQKKLQNQQTTSAPLHTR